MRAASKCISMAVEYFRQERPVDLIMIVLIHILGACDTLIACKEEAKPELVPELVGSEVIMGNTVSDSNPGTSRKHQIRIEPIVEADAEDVVAFLKECFYKVRKDTSS